MSFRGFCLSLLALVPAYLALAAILPPFDDELYYWCWSRDLQLSYYDHPPMVAYMIRAATEFFGDGIIAIRLPAILSATIVAGVIGWLSRPRCLLPLVLLSPVLTFAAVLVTPDTPLLMFWAFYLAWLVRVHERLASEEPNPPPPFPTKEGGARRPSPRGGGVGRGSSESSAATGGLGLSLWLLGGVILGCGVLGKYTTGLAAMAGGVSFLFAGNWRRWAGGYAFHAVVAMLVASPILIHNIQYDFAPIRYQWAHSMSSPNPGFGVFAEFVGVQIVLFGTIPITVFIWSLRHRTELLADPRLRVCLCLFVLPFTFFLLKATRGRIEGNWAFPCYLACWPLAAEWYRRVRESAWWRWATRGGFAFPMATSTLFLVHIIHPLPFFPPGHDRPTRQWERMAVGRAIAKDIQAAGYSGPVYAPNYQWTAILRWHGIDARQIDDTLRASHFTEHGYPALSEIHGLVFAEAPQQPAEFHGLGPPRSAVCYPLVVRGVAQESCWLLDYSERGAAVGGERAVANTRRLDPPPPYPPR